MSKHKTDKVKLTENRCQGYGSDYVPFHKANEGGGRATCYMIPDPIEGRMVHCLSDTEAMFYYLIRWNQEVVHIREQYLLDYERVCEVRRELGYKVPNKLCCYTTDFLVDFRDGRQQAHSVKFRDEDFNPNSKVYQGRGYAYVHLIERQNTEKRYWESLGVPFYIVTRDRLMEHRTFIKNVAFIEKFWDEEAVVTEEQMLLYLMAHHIVEFPLDEEFINPKKLTKMVNFDIQKVFEQTVGLRKELLT